MILYTLKDLLTSINHTSHVLTIPFFQFCSRDTGNEFQMKMLQCAELVPYTKWWS